MGENEVQEEEILFSKGSRVEVSSNDEGFTGAWYAATVVSTPYSFSSTSPQKKKKSPNPLAQNKFLVKYDTLLDDVSSKFLTEYVDVSFIRPLPPTLDTTVDGDGHYTFEVNDVVDAFHRDGWWTGVVTKFIDDGGGSRRFVVNFNKPRDRIECHGSDLRFHLDWVASDWVRPDKQEVLVTSSGDQEKSGYSNGNANYAMDLMDIERASSDAAMDNPKPDDANSNADVKQSLRKYKARNAVEDQLSITPPCRLVIKRNMDALSGFTAPAKGATRSDCFKHSSDDDQLSTKNKSHLRKKTMSKEQSVGGLDSGSNKLKRKKRIAKKMSHSERSNTSAKGNERNPMRFTSEEFLEKERIEDVMFAKVTRGLEAENSHLLPAKESLESVQDQDPHAMEPEKSITEINESKGEESLLRKKRGRPRKSLGIIPKGSAEGERHEVAAGALDQMALKDGATSVLEFPSQLQKSINLSDSFKDLASRNLSKECLKLIADNERFLSGVSCCNSKRKLKESKYEQLNVTVAQNRVEQTKKILLDGHQEKSTSVNNCSPTQGNKAGFVLDSGEAPQGNSSEVYKLDCGAKDATNVIDDEMPSHIFDDQPLLMWLGGVKSAKMLNNGGISHSMALDPRDDRSDGQNDVATPTQSPAVIVNSDSVKKSETLPFAKCSPVWNSIESLEVFQKNPQRPHFSPLVRCKEDSREGLAIGHMVTFANLVGRTLKLQLSDPQSIIESSLETLAELENHGFDVESVRKRLNELQALKVRMGRLEELSKEAEGEIMKLNLEKRELEEMMDKVAMKMKEIQEKLAVAVSMKETKVKKVDVWQSKANSIVDSLENAKRDFERVVASPLWAVVLKE